MSIVTTDNRFYSEIAAAIRQKNGESTLYLPADMAEAILAIKGGGDAFAAISVTYPEGSVCTCTQPGQTPLTAGDTSGAWLFLVPAGGEWTITASNGIKSKFVDVSVTQHSVAAVAIRYSFYLIENGAPQVPLTNLGNFSITETQVKTTGTSNTAMRTTDKISVEGYEKLYVEAYITGKTNGYPLNLVFTNNTALNGYYQGNPANPPLNAIAYSATTTVNNTPLSANVTVSGLSETIAYIGIGLGYANGSTINNLWLE